MPKKSVISLCVSALLAACAVTPPPPSPTATAAAVTPSPSAPRLVSPTPAGSLTTNLRVWLPPQYAPDDSAAGGKVLAEQIARFEQTHPGQAVEIRIKSVSGPGGLLESLATAYNAAPAVLPDVVALDRNGLVAAASAGLVIPLDNLLPPDVLADYYPFAQTMSRHKDAIVGLPFAADARVLAYKTDLYASPPQTWAEITTGTLIIPAGEAAGLTLLNEYLAMGGPLADPSGKTVLDAELLTEALAAFQTVHTSGWLPLSTLAYSDTLSTWQVFRERRATLAVTNAQSFLSEPDRVAGAAAALLPTGHGLPFALADGWCWALVNTAAPQHQVAVELLTWLTDPVQLSAWTRAAHVLPTRPAALEGWGTDRLAPFASDVLSHAHLQPSTEVLAAAGPPLQRALDDVLNGRATPFAAAAAASQSVASP